MKRSAALRVEALEDRSVPAGTVTISGWGTGNINVIGDPRTTKSKSPSLAVQLH